MFKHLINIKTPQLRNLMLVWKRIIAGIQMVKIQFGAIPQIQIKDGHTVTQFSIRSNATNWSKSYHMIKLKLLLNHKTRGFRQEKSWLTCLKVMGANHFLMVTIGHLSETLMETKTTFRLDVALL